MASSSKIPTIPGITKKEPSRKAMGQEKMKTELSAAKKPRKSSKKAPVSSSKPGKKERTSVEKPIDSSSKAVIKTLLKNYSGKTTWFGVNLDLGLKEATKALAKAEGTTLAKCVETALKERIERRLVV